MQDGEVKMGTGKNGFCSFSKYKEQALKIGSEFTSKSAQERAWKE